MAKFKHVQLLGFMKLNLSLFTFLENRWLFKIQFGNRFWCKLSPQLDSHPLQTSARSWNMYTITVIPPMNSLLVSNRLTRPYHMQPIILNNIGFFITQTHLCTQRIFQIRPPFSKHGILVNSIPRNTSITPIQLDSAHQLPLTKLINFTITWILSIWR